MVETIKLEWLKTDTELINILRWEDDGGKIVEVNYSKLDRHFVQPVRLALASHDPSVPQRVPGKGETQ